MPQEQQQQQKQQLKQKQQQQEEEQEQQQHWLFSEKFLPLFSVEKTETIKGGVFKTSRYHSGLQSQFFLSNLPPIKEKPEDLKDQVEQSGFRLKCQQFIFFFTRIFVEMIPKHCELRMILLESMIDARKNGKATLSRLPFEMLTKTRWDLMRFHLT